MNKIDKKLLLENRYFELFENYSYTNYSKALNFESMIETGKKYNRLKYKINNLVIYKDYNFIKELKYTLLKYSMYGIITFNSFFILMSGMLKQTNIDTYNNNQEEIIEYDKNIEEYVKSIDTNNMTTMEIIMKVMNDIRSNTQYGINPDKEDIYNNYRLVLDNNNDIGVCRHMADKFTTTMNMINPEYEAYNLLVHLNSDCNTFKSCDIEKPLSKQYLENNDSNEETELNKKMLANHMVTVLKDKEHNCYLVVDVTNPSIGILKNGKIYMFNSNDYTFIEYRPISQYITNYNHYSDVNIEFLLSNLKNNDIEELDKIYGLKSQNKTLKKIK